MLQPHSHHVLGIDIDCQADAPAADSCGILQQLLAQLMKQGQSAALQEHLPPAFVLDSGQRCRCRAEYFHRCVTTATGQGATEKMADPAGAVLHLCLIAAADSDVDQP